MNDTEIINLYFARSEAAIAETEKSYGVYLKKIAFNILGNASDCEECVNDTYLNAWNRIPPANPESLGAFLAKIAREKAIDIYRKNKAAKRSSNFKLSINELSECVPSDSHTEKSADARQLANEISRFLKKLPEDGANIFVERYFFCDSISEIAQRRNTAEGTVKSKLHRMRKALKKHLKKEGYDI